MPAIPIKIPAFNRVVSSMDRAGWRAERGWRSWLCRVVADPVRRRAGCGVADRRGLPHSPLKAIVDLAGETFGEAQPAQSRLCDLYVELSRLVVGGLIAL